MPQFFKLAICAAAIAAAGSAFAQAGSVESQTSNTFERKTERSLDASAKGSASIKMADLLAAGLSQTSSDAASQVSRAFTNSMLSFEAVADNAIGGNPQKFRSIRAPWLAAKDTAEAQHLAKLYENCTTDQCVSDLVYKEIQAGMFLVAMSPPVIKFFRGAADEMTGQIYHTECFSTWAPKAYVAGLSSRAVMLHLTKVVPKDVSMSIEARRLALVKGFFAAPLDTFIFSTNYRASLFCTADNMATSEFSAYMRDGSWTRVQSTSSGLVLTGEGKVIFGQGKVDGVELAYTDERAGSNKTSSSKSTSNQAVSNKETAIKSKAPKKSKDF